MLGGWVDALKKYYPPCGGAKKQKPEYAQQPKPKKTEQQRGPPKEDLREHLDSKKRNQQPSLYLYMIF